MSLARQGGLRWTAPYSRLTLLQRELKWKSSVNTFCRCAGGRVAVWADDAGSVDTPAHQGHLRHRNVRAARRPTARVVLDALRIEAVGSTCLGLVTFGAGNAVLDHHTTRRRIDEGRRQRAEN